MLTLARQNSMTAPAPASGQTAVVVVAGSVNYYYDAIGYRIAEALRNIGFQVDACTLRQVKDREYDWSFFMPMNEVCVAFGDVEQGMRRVGQIVARSRNAVDVMLECVQTSWFAESYKLHRRANIPTLLDLGLHDQTEQMPPGMGTGYYFAVNGLTRSEQKIAQRMLTSPAVRPIPWTFIGHLEKNRIQLVQRLMDHLDKNGFVYLPTLSHITEDGPHMNGKHMQDTLERTRFFIWCTHHDYFYMESERFRSALLAGAVPIKVMQNPIRTQQAVPFRYLMLEQATFDEQLQTLDFESVRQRFSEEFCALPSLEQELTKLIARGSANV